MLILLDGSKGAGKSSTAEVLINRLHNSIHLGIDNERRALPYHSGSRDEKNKIAFDSIVEKTKKFLKDGTSVVIDCGLTPERISILERIAKDADTKLYKFFLKAPYEVQLDRVRARDKSKGKMETDIDRFDEIHKIIHSKELDGFTIFETDKMGIEEVASTILKMVS